jgi:hypothetical protein
LPSSTRKANVFVGRSVLLSQDLGVGNRTRKILEDIINGGNGTIVFGSDRADTIICQYRNSADFVTAIQKGKEVGNLSWLYYLITYNKWTNPHIRLMHYPVPRNGIPGFENFVISLSNYTGDARVYLENLVKACGAEFSKALRHGSTTHLVTAHTESEKVTAAKEWNINIVNHLWVEDSYARFCVQSLTIPRYTHFPERTNLGEVVGQTPVDKAAIDRCVAEIVAREDRQQPTPSDGSVSPAKENDVPPGMSSRAAKSRAMDKLSKAAEDIALYDRERKRVGGVVHGRDRRRSDADEGQDENEVKVGRRKRKSSGANDSETEVETETIAHPKKKGKTMPAIQHRMILTMYQRWIDRPTAETMDRVSFTPHSIDLANLGTRQNKLRNLGIHIVEDTNSSISLLCAPKIARTRKFVCALSQAPVVVSTAFLDHCLSDKTVPDPEDYPLRDAEGESRLGYPLAGCLERAEANRQKLLAGRQVFCTEQVPGGYKNFKDIVEVNGGSFHLFTAKTNMTLKKRGAVANGNSSKDSDDRDDLYLISDSSKAEKALWSKFQAMAERADMRPVIVKSEWLLSVTMAQEFHWNEQWLLG